MYREGVRSGGLVIKFRSYYSVVKVLGQEHCYYVSSFFNTAGIQYGLIQIKVFPECSQTTPVR